MRTKDRYMRKKETTDEKSPELYLIDDFAALLRDMDEVRTTPRDLGGAPPPLPRLVTAVVPPPLRR